MIFVNRLTKASAKQMQWGINMLSKNLKDLLKLVLEYTEDSDKHKVDEVAIEQRLQDIEDSLEQLAIEIEVGDFEDDAEYTAEDAGCDKYHQRKDDEMTGDR